uniref:Uncharacterized protein n=1 Tax=Anguilla anguilla TaxID=7936 RepID=A0A0E9PAG4_ANGAN
MLPEAVLRSRRTRMESRPERQLTRQFLRGQGVV